MWETPQTYGRRYSGQMRTKFSFLAIRENAISGANPTPLITPRTPSPKWSMVVAASCCGDVFSSAGTGKLVRIEGMLDGTKYSEILEVFSHPEIWDWDGASPSSRAMTLSILLKQHSSGLRGNIYMSWNGLVKAQTSIKLKICVWLQDCCTPAEPIQLEGAAAVLSWRMGKNPSDVPSL